MPLTALTSHESASDDVTGVFMATEGVVIRVVSTSVLMSCFLDALSCAVCKWSHYKLKKGRWPFPQSNKQRRKQILLKSVSIRRFCLKLTAPSAKESLRAVSHTPLQCYKSNSMFPDDSLRQIPFGNYCYMYSSHAETWQKATKR